MTDIKIAEAQTEGLPPVEITVFTKNSCPKCKITYAKFERDGVPYRAINVEEDVEPRAEFAGADGAPRTPRDYVVEEFGLRMPVVEIRAVRSDDGVPGERIDGWSDIDPVKLGDTSAQYGSKG